MNEKYKRMVFTVLNSRILYITINQRYKFPPFEFISYNFHLTSLMKNNYEYLTSLKSL